MISHLFLLSAALLPATVMGKKKKKRNSIHLRHLQVFGPDPTNKHRHVTEKGDQKNNHIKSFCLDKIAWIALADCSGPK